MPHVLSLWFRYVQARVSQHFQWLRWQSLLKFQLTVDVRDIFWSGQDCCTTARRVSSAITFSTLAQDVSLPVVECIVSEPVEAKRASMGRARTSLKFLRTLQPAVAMDEKLLM